MRRVKASEGVWYSDRSTREIFCVIRVDDGDGLIDVRDGYGDIDEFDFDEWDHMDLEIVAAPGSWLSDEDDDEEEDESGSAATRAELRAPAPGASKRGRG